MWHEDWCNKCRKFSFAIKINYILKYIKIEKFFKLQYYFNIFKYISQVLTGMVYIHKMTDGTTFGY